MKGFKEYVRENEQALLGLNMEKVSLFVEGLRELRDSGGALWIAGNGGSAASASHAVADFVKTSTGFGSATLKSFALSEATSLQTALANDISFESAMSWTLRSVASSKDGLLILSVSGLSPNLIAAQAEGRSLGLKTFSITGLRGTQLASNCDYPLLVPSDDYQVVENAHMALIHWCTKTLGAEK